MAVRDLMDNLGGTEARVELFMSTLHSHSYWWGVSLLQRDAGLSTCTFPTLHFLLETAFQLETTPKSGAEQHFNPLHKKRRVRVAEDVKNNQNAMHN